MMAKKILTPIFATFLVIILFFWLTEKDENIISGDLKNLKQSDKIILATSFGTPTGDSFEILDSAQVEKDGKFKIESKVKDELVTIIFVPGAENFDKTKRYPSLRVFLEGFSETKIEGDINAIDSIKVISSKLNFDDIFKNDKNLDSFIYNSPKSNFAAYLIRYDLIYRETSIDKIDSLYNTLTDKVKNGKWGKKIFTYISNIKSASEGAQAPEVTLIDSNGHKVSPSQYKGKVLLIEFWGSWCPPCRSSNPHLVELYNKYNSQGFEILGIACREKSDDVWKKAISDDKLTWTQANNNQTIESKKMANEVYAIIQYPTSILIDRSGKIVFRGHPEDLEEALTLQMGK